MGQWQEDTFGTVLNDETGEEEAIYPLNYWLGAVEYFMREYRRVERVEKTWKEKNLSLYLIQNQKLTNNQAEPIRELNNKELKEKCGVDGLYTFCLSRDATQTAKDAAQKAVLDLIEKHKISRKQPQSYTNLRKAISEKRDEGNVVLNIEKFQNSLPETFKGIGDIREAIANLSYSVACHYLKKKELYKNVSFENIPFEEGLLANFIIDQREFTGWLYEILTIKELRDEKDGYFKKTDAERWLKTEEAKEHLDYMLGFMLHHKIIFEVKGESDRYVVPQYLKPVMEDPPTGSILLKQFKTPLVQYEFESYFHINILAELIKKCYDHLLQEKNSWKYLMWKNKILLFDKKADEMLFLFLNAEMPKEGTLSKPVICLNRHPLNPVNDEFVQKIMEFIEDQIEYYTYPKLVKAPDGRYIPFEVVSSRT